MKRNELIAAISQFISEKEAVSAPGLDMLRLALAELQVSGPAAAPVIKTVAAEIPAYLRTAETMAYDVLAELGIIPEEEEEPLPDLEAALGAEPELPQRALNMIAPGMNALKFADAVRQLLGAVDVENLNQLYGLLTSKAEYITSLEAELRNRDNLLADGDAAVVRLNAIREKLGIPEGVQGPVGLVEIAAIDLLINQRQAAQDRALVGRDEVPPEGTLESIVDRCLAAMHMDWQDVEVLPEAVSKASVTARMHEAELQVLAERPTRIELRRADDDIDVVDPDVRLVIVGWVNDCVDLAHAVRGDLSPENRVMAKAAQHIIETAPREAL